MTNSASELFSLKNSFSLIVSLISNYDIVTVSVNGKYGQVITIPISKIKCRRSIISNDCNYPRNSKRFIHGDAAHFYM